MTWLILALTTAFSLSTADALTKRALRGTDELVVAWVRQGYSLPFLVLPLFFIPIPQLDRTFWLTLAALLPLEITALILYVRAIRVSPLSLSIPFLALSPVFIIIIAFLLLGERPSGAGLLGVALIAGGAWTLNASASREGLLGPMRAIAREPGSVLMIIVALIYSVTSTLGKVAVLHSGPVFFGLFYPFILTLILTAALAARGKMRLAASRPWTFLSIGFFTAAMIVTHFIAISLTQVAYMISVKRTSLIFSVIYGRVLFGEEKVTERLAGSVVMAAGVALIALG